MASVANKRSVMVLYTGVDDFDSHRVRLVLAEKGINYEAIDVVDGNKPEDLMELNPYGSVPTLVDRDLVLYDSQVIMEYLDERFPHPPLMPVDPVSRAGSRQYLARITKDWLSLLPDIESGEEKKAAKARKSLSEGLTVVAPMFDMKPFFMSEEYSLVDCVMATLLWRLPVYGIDLPKSASPILSYAEKLFERDAFQESLTEAEREIRS